METFVITWREVLLVVVLVLAVYIAELLLLMRAGGVLRKPGWLSMIEEKKFEADMRQQLEELGRRVAMLEAGAALRAALPTQPLSSSEFDWSVTPTPPIRPDVQPQAIEEETQTQQENVFQKAVQMAGKGVSAEELVARCGISRGEADMIIALHKP